MIVQLPSAVRAYLAEPAVADPPRRVRRDWMLVAVAAATAALEAWLRTDAAWTSMEPGWRWGELIVLCATVLPALLIRRTRPLLAVVLAFVPMLSYGVVVAQYEDYGGGLVTGGVALVTVYALYRWGSGRDGLVGIGVVAAAGLTGLLTSTGTSVGDWIGGFVVLGIPIEMGLLVRYRGAAQQRRIEAVKAHEREELARELHDTVAHHVSAIAVQAQAGRALAATDPDRALAVLAVIEEAASRTLADMRAMVGTLRRGAAEMAPQHGVADLAGLADHRPGDLEVDVRVAESLGDVGPATDVALYRIAQESITNARRHARGATRVTVWVDPEPDAIRLTVQDDGEPPSGRPGDGFGLLGMAERAELLGGHFSAGPSGDRGWRVEAALPRRA